MSDERVRTFVQTHVGLLPFQEYFVKQRAEVPIHQVVFDGSESARPTSEVLRAIAETEAIIVCPSNPIVSIGPILALHALREAIQNFRGPRIGIRPLVGGRALKGPTVQMMEGLGLQRDATGVARLWRDIVDVFVIDPVDESLGSDIEALGIQVAIHPIVMDTVEEKIRVAKGILKFASPRH
jgi:LPPG:FO 2-phospho-L-lactate transferase